MGHPRWTVEQARAIDQLPQHAVVYAGPGSGKTAVLVEHCAIHLQRQAVPADKLWMIAFTCQAAAELKSRLLAHQGLRRSQVETVQIGTFHSQVFHLLLRAGLPVHTPLHASEQQRVLRRLLAEEGLSQPWQLRDLLQQMNLARAVYPPGSIQDRRIAKVVKRYEHWKQLHRRWDFDDMLQRFAGYVDERHPRLAQACRLSYLVVDEYQDTNPVQAWLVASLSRWFSAPVRVVGDDDQSIYGFRGASPHQPDELLHFGGDFLETARGLDALLGSPCRLGNRRKAISSGRSLHLVDRARQFLQIALLHQPGDLVNALRQREERTVETGFRFADTEQNAARWRSWFRHLQYDQAIFFWLLNSVTILLFIFGALAVLH
ncbi:MAG: UvrD-helicase domain-containing protein, partial [Alicyclobacillus sp.]|nr:UvrD-helicase domain-containing protein [Alicyclobacillus sp.]